MYAIIKAISIFPKKSMYLKTTLKVIFVTAILTICIQISTQFLWTASQKQVELLSAKSKEEYGNIWVALSTNIWTRFKQRTELPAQSYTSVIAVSDILGKEETINDELIKANMLFLQDYLNLMKINLNDALQNGSDRKTSLETLITQFDLRQKNALINLQTVTTQVANLTAKMQSLDAQVTALKTHIGLDFQSVDTPAIIEDKNNYLDLKNQWTEARTYIIFYDQFIVQYNYLNNYNTQVLDTLTNNRDIIIKNSYVVLPDTGTTILKDLNLIINEADYKTAGWTSTGSTTGQ